MAFKDTLKNAKKKSGGNRGEQRGNKGGQKGKPSGGKSKKGMGFKAAVNSVKKGGKGKYSDEAARAIVAAASRNASPASKKKNPNLKRVR